MRRSRTVLPDRHERRRPQSPFRIWLLCAVPWLLLVTACSIYDHHRAIYRTTLAYLESLVASGMALDSVHGGIAFAAQWLAAAVRYVGDPVAFYGALPAAITFAVFVLFLPWAVPWAQRGEFED